MLLLPIVIPTVCGIIAGIAPAFRKDETRRLLVLASLLVTLGVTAWQLFAGGAAQTLLTIAPGMEIAVPERTETSSGCSGLPNLRPLIRSKSAI